MVPRKSVVVVIAKSGGTAETVATFLIVGEWVTEALGRRKLALAQSDRYREFGNPENVGGRCSVLTPVGLAPGALAGASARVPSNAGDLVAGKFKYGQTERKSGAGYRR